MSVLNSSAVDADLWVWPLRKDKSCVKQLLLFLSDDERDRAGRMKSQTVQKNFIVARGGMRQVLARYQGDNAAGLQFEYGPYGKPVLKNTSLQFNLSHSSGWAALAVTRDCEIGVDIEAERHVTPGFAERFFSGAEAMVLSDLSQSERMAAFFRIWTAKEAAGKALGLGLGLDFKSFTIHHTANRQTLCVPVGKVLGTGRKKTLYLSRFSWLPDIHGCVAVATGRPVNLHIRSADDGTDFQIIHSAV